MTERKGAYARAQEAARARHQATLAGVEAPAAPALTPEQERWQRLRCAAEGCPMYGTIGRGEHFRCRFHYAEPLHRWPEVTAWLNEHRDHALVTDPYSVWLAGRQPQGKPLTEAQRELAAERAAIIGEAHA